MTDGTPARPLHVSETAAPHREEMRATLEVSLGRAVSLRTTARATPAGLAAATGLAAAILVPMIWIVRGWKRRGGGDRGTSPPAAHRAMDAVETNRDDRPR